ncbi:MAG: NAD(P)H-binding protein [Spirochaetes bacterium]|nr:NAD(P)H-binding protein [Spirochaetota bacterium]
MANHAVLAGATGLVGAEVLRQLAVDARFDRVVVLARSPAGAGGAKLAERRVDFSRPAEWAGEVRGDCAVCCLGTTIKRAGSRGAFRAVDFDMAFAFARAARENGVPHFLLVSALGANARSSMFYMRVKGELEEAVRGLGFPSLTLLRPSLLTGPRKEKRFAEAVARAVAPLYDFVMVGPLKKYRSVAGAVVARALVESAARPPAGLRLLEGDAIAAYAATPHD